MPSPSVEHPTYRPEIQGIRTIGALLVAAFHIWGGRVSGGVDVFFVISGFLMTGSLYKEMQRTRSIDVIAFWGRIARRVTPMASLVLTLTLVAAWLWMPQVRQAAFLSEVLYSVFHLENVKLMMNSVDYLARDEAPSPVQQFWALSVQVQFYAIWPFLLLGIGFAARRLRSTWVAYATVLAAVILASLTYSVIETNRNSAATYFDPLARMWEFALGGILAVVLPHVSIASKVRLIAGWLGLLAVISCGFVLPASASFPGYVALWPTLGAALVLIAGNSGTRHGVERLLAFRPLAAFGEISFSFYLWHWPVLIYFMIVSGRTQLGLLSGLLVIAVALCGAYSTNRWLERPIQSAMGHQKVWRVHAMAAGLLMPVLALSSAWELANGRAESRQREAAERMIQNYLGGTNPMSLATAAMPGIPIHPRPAAVRYKHPNRCQQNETRPDVLTCDYGVVDGARKTIALVGGSHAEHWLPALERLAYEQQWKIVAVTKSACPLIPGRGHPSCVQWNKNVHDAVVKIRPDAVFTTSTRRRAPGPASIEYVPDAYLNYWSSWAAKGITVIAVRDTARTSADAFECIERSLHDLAKCARPRRQLFDDVDPTSKLNPQPANVSFIDLTGRFCDQDLCPPVGGNVLIYRDTHHITIEYARTLAGPLGERMHRVRPDLFSMKTATDSRHENRTDLAKQAQAPMLADH